MVLRTVGDTDLCRRKTAAPKSISFCELFLFAKKKWKEKKDF